MGQLRTVVVSHDVNTVVVQVWSLEAAEYLATSSTTLADGVFQNRSVNAFVDDQREAGVRMGPTARISFSSPAFPMLIFLLPPCLLFCYSNIRVKSCALCSELHVLLFAYICTPRFRTVFLIFHVE